MPIKNERIMPGVYCNHWQGHVNADEVLEAFNNETQMAKDDNQIKRVSILDGSEMRTFPMNIAKLSKAVSPDVVATIIYNVPRVARTLGEIIGSLAKTSIEFHDDWDVAVARASELLQEHNTVSSPVK